MLEDFSKSSLTEKSRSLFCSVLFNFLRFWRNFEIAINLFDDSCIQTKYMAYVYIFFYK